MMKCLLWESKECALGTRPCYMHTYLTCYTTHTHTHTHTHLPHTCICGWRLPGADTFFLAAAEKAEGVSSCRSVDCWEWSSSGPLDEDRADRLPPRLSPFDCRERERERERAGRVNTQETDAPKSRRCFVDVSC